jgi:hypothetical protein
LSAITLPIGNIYAPPWMCVSPSIAGYEDITYYVDLPTVTIPASTVQLGTTSNGQTLSLDGDFDFLVTEMQFCVFPVADETFQPTDLRVRIRDAFGRLVTSDFVYAQNLCGSLPMIWGLKRNGNLTFDFQNVNATNAISVQVVLKGWKRRACPGMPARISPYVPMYRRYAVPIQKGVELEDFEYYNTFTSTGAGDLLRVPIRTDNDADFLWRGIQGDWNTANNDVAVVGNVGLRFYDPNSVALSVTGTTNPWNSPNVGQFRESLLSSGGGGVAPMYPEILIPKNGTVEVDLSFGAAATVRLSLRGLKVYREGF